MNVAKVLSLVPGTEKTQSGEGEEKEEKEKERKEEGEGGLPTFNFAKRKHLKLTHNPKYHFHL